MGAAPAAGAIPATPPQRSQLLARAGPPLERSFELVHHLLQGNWSSALRGEPRSPSSCPGAPPYSMFLAGVRLQVRCISLLRSHIATKTTSALEQRTIAEVAPRDAAAVEKPLPWLPDPRGLPARQL